MKNIFKIGFILFIIALIIIISLNFFLAGGNREIHTVIPKDALFILKSDNIEQTLNELKNNNLWKIPSEYVLMKEIQQKANFIGFLEHQNKEKKSESDLKYRKIAISGHLSNKNTADLLFAVDLENNSKKMSVLSNALSFKNKEINTKKIIYGSVDIFEVSKKKSETKLYVTFCENILIFSENLNILKRSVKSWNRNSWNKVAEIFKVTNNKFTELNTSIILNHQALNKTVSLNNNFKWEGSQKIINNLYISGAKIDIDDSYIKLFGATQPSENSALSLLLNVKPSKIRSHKIISNNAIYYVSFTFDNFQNLFYAIEQHYSENSPKTLNDYNTATKNLVDNTNISLHHHIYSWIGNEITFVQTHNNSEKHGDLMLIHSKDIDQAKKRLEFTAKHLSSNALRNSKSFFHENFKITPFKQINALKILGLDYIFPYESTYYTTIRNFVVFAQDIITLKNFIDDYINRNTLLYNKKSKEIIDNGINKQNISIYVNMPKWYLSDKSKFHKHLLSKRNYNKIISNIDLIFLRLTANDEIFDAKIEINSSKNALINERNNILSEKLMGDLLLKQIPIDLQKVLSYMNDSVNDGECKIYSEKNNVIAYGNVVNKKPNGIWKTFYKSGNLRSIINWRQGEASGIVVYYFDSSEAIKRVETRMENGKFNSTFLEYFVNGNLKVSFEYSDGNKNGKARIYVKEGQPILEGEYKDNRLINGWQMLL